MEPDLYLQYFWDQMCIRDRNSNMARMFGTDGVRGVAGSELTIELATKLGQAGAYVLTKERCV